MRRDSKALVRSRDTLTDRQWHLLLFLCGSSSRKPGQVLGFPPKENAERLAVRQGVMRQLLKPFGFLLFRRSPTQALGSDRNADER